MMRVKEAKAISIRAFLEHSGIKPSIQRKSDTECWYSSPIRNGDKHPSFKVDTIKNLWFDFGLAQGGDIIDLVCELTKPRATVKQALAILEASGLAGYSFSHSIQKSNLQQSLPDKKITVAGEKEKSSFAIISITELHTPYLIAYLHARNINLAVARHYLKEIHFTNKTNQKTTDKEKSYHALGFPSNGGFEIRNKGFKSFIGTHKTISTINLENNNSLSIFEGFMDFLAFLSYQNINDFKNSVIILNSIYLRKQALAVINDYHFSNIYLFLDNDEAGINTKQFFIEQLNHKTPITDKSSLYKNYKDFNHMTIETKKWLT